jgi:adenylate kinase family enzyme
MIIFLVGPTLSGKTTLATKLASLLRLTVVDIGQIVRLTADEQDAARIRSGELSSRGDTEWVSDIVKRSIDEYQDNVIFVGYPRTVKQLEYIDTTISKYILIALLADKHTIESRSKRSRPDDKSWEVKFSSFYCDLLPKIYHRVDFFMTNETPLDVGSICTLANRHL